MSYMSRKRAASRPLKSGVSKKYRKAPVRRKRFVPKPEKKFFDSTDTITVPTAGDVNASLNLITEGNGDNDRVGRKIVADKLYIKGKLELAGQTDPDNACSVVRVIVYIDKQSNGATAAVTDILASASWKAYRNLTNVERFVILHDETIEMAASAGGWYGSGLGGSFCNVKCFNWGLDCRQTPLLFDASTGAITDLTSANIGVLAISSKATVGLDYTARLRFWDN